MDELFGVTNNKQSVRGIDYINEADFRKEHPDDYQDILDHDLKIKMRVELSRKFSQLHKLGMETIKSRDAGKRGGSPAERAASDPSTRIANQQLESSKAETRSAKEGTQKNRCTETSRMAKAVN